MPYQRSENNITRNNILKKEKVTKSVNNYDKVLTNNKSQAIEQNAFVFTIIGSTYNYLVSLSLIFIYKVDSPFYVQKSG